MVNSPFTVAAVHSCSTDGAGLFGIIVTTEPAPIGFIYTRGKNPDKMTRRNNTNYSNVNAATQKLLYCGLKVACSAERVNGC
jgi:hypothetical protein